ncbi:hypothetical protein OG225_26325 [Nocardia sp. NBC_01377]|uniref:DUF7919 family protein n=1 Tax=Nocardia sp. NBC_01377 TaxID=2903595 RepID=UPI00324466C0
MTYFKDGTTYSYLQEFADGAINIGWLDAAEPYARCESLPQDFIDTLIQMCRKSVNKTRGWHVCNLCPPSTDIVPAPTVQKSPEGDFPLGFGEIRVSSNTGTRYAAPDMIAHYVVAHNYSPPQEFVDAALNRDNAE